MADTLQKRQRLLVAEAYLRNRVERHRGTLPLIVRALSQGLICWGCKKNWTSQPERMAVIEPVYWKGRPLKFVICHECVANGISAEHARHDFYRRFP